ncbi:MAG: TSUP family transporter [Bacteroidetes bacterium]|nr:MAG: TSUP family transporter [Bacteroidota bacterium]
MVNDPETFVILFTAALFAGFVDAIAGGGGLIALPALLAVGVPPQIALGTNKFQGTFGSITAAVYYWRKGIVDLRKARTGILFTFAGAAAGAWAVQQVSPEFLNTLIPLLLFCIAVYTIVTPALGRSDAPPKMGVTPFYALFGVLLGFYDGFFGPGVGSFWAIALMVMLGMEIQKATGYTKVMNFSSNIIAIVIFIAGGSVWFVHGFVMAAGQVVGAQFGARWAVKKGIAIIKPLYITVVLATVLKLLYNRFFV